MPKSRISNFMRTTALTAAGITAALSIASPAYAVLLNPIELPTGGTVEAGTAVIKDNSTKIFGVKIPGDTMNINQSSDRAVINWKSFNIGVLATVNFNQPSSTALTVNRVKSTGTTASEIWGKLKANGTVMIIDPNGVIFGATSVVDTHGILVSTGSVATSDVMNNNIFKITNIKNKKIELNGTIKVADSGIAAFVSPFVKNSGTINAKLGKVTMAAGTKVTVDLYGDNLISIAASDKVSDALLENSGTINANGGTVAMTVNTAASLVDEVINMTGVINADSVSTKNGKIVLNGGNGKVTVGADDALSDALVLLNNNGNLNASNGTIDITSSSVVLGYETNMSAKDISVTTDNLNIYETTDYLLADAASIAADSFYLTRKTAGAISLGNGTSGLALTNDDINTIVANSLYIGSSDSSNKVNRINLDGVDISSKSTSYVEFNANNVIAVAANSTVNLGAADVTANTATLNLASNVTTTGDILGDADTVNVRNNNVSINQGIDFAKVGGTVNIAAGTYTEAVYAYKSVTINGANAGLAGDDTSRGAETIIANAGTWYNLYADADNVTIDGLKITGDGSSSVADYAVYTSGDNTTIQNSIIAGANYDVTIDGADAAAIKNNKIYDASYGILASGTSNTTIEGNEVYNAQFGMFFYKDATGTANSGNLVTNNTVHDMSEQAIHIRDSQYTNVTNNTIYNSAVGITVENMTAASPDSKIYTIADNDVSAARIGIRSNMMGSVGTGYLIEDNTIKAEDATLSRRWTGIDIVSQPSAVTTTFRNNTIDASAIDGSGRLAIGYEATSVASNTLLIDGGSISGVDYGVWATDGSFYTGAVNNLTIQNVAFNNVRYGDIVVEDTIDTTNDTKIKVNTTSAHVTIGTGNTFSGTAYNLVLKGANASATTDANAGVVKTLATAAGNATYTGAVFNTTTAALSTESASIQNAINATNVGGTITIEDGTYNLASTLNYTKDSITLQGTSEAGTIIDASKVTGYGINLTAKNATINDLTFIGGSSYGVKATGNNLTLTDFTAKGANITEIDLNGVDTATLVNVTADGLNTNGTGISMTNSSNIYLENITTTGNNWGGIGIYQNTDGVTLTGTNSFAEAIKVYTEVDGWTPTNGAAYTITDLKLGGFNYSVVNTGHRADGTEFVYYQLTESDAINFALALSAVNTGYIQTLSTDVNGYTVRDNNFIVTQNALNSLSIQAAINAASTGGVINVYAGNYVEDVSVNKSVTLLGANAGISGSATRGAETIISSAGTLPWAPIQVWYADNVTVDGFTINGAAYGLTIDDSNNANIVNNIIQNFNISGIDALMYSARSSNTLTIANNLIDGAGSVANSIAVAGNSGDTIIKNNEIINSAGNGIMLQNNDYAKVSNNTVTGTGTGYGLVSSGTSNYLVVSGNTLTNNLVGASFNSATIDLTGKSNTFNNNTTAIEFSENSSYTPTELVDNTLGNQFINNSSTYIALKNGAFANATAPINAYFVSFDGEKVSEAVSPYAESELVKAIEAKIIDKDDDSTLGQIFVGSTLEDSDYDYEDRLAALGGAYIPSYSRFSINLRGMPYISAAQMMSAMAPAAGGNSPANLNRMEPAAGGKTSGCLNDLGSGANIQMNYDDDVGGLLQQVNACPVGI